jgi:hypothetical protein
MPPGGVCRLTVRTRTTGTGPHSGHHETGLPMRYNALEPGFPGVLTGLYTWIAMLLAPSRCCWLHRDAAGSIAMLLAPVWPESGF